MESPSTRQHIADAVSPFNLISLDISSLQKLLFELTQQVQACHKENAGLKKELQDLKIANRLLSLEFTFEDFRSDLQAKWEAFEKRFRTAGSGTVGAQPLANSLKTQQSEARIVPDPGGGQQVEVPTIISSQQHANQDFNVLQDRLTNVERRCDEMWQAQVDTQLSKAAVGRLQIDVENVQQQVAQFTQHLHSVQSKGDGLGSTVAGIHLQAQRLQDRIKMVEEQQQSDTKEAITSYAKREQQMQSIQDRLKAVESSMGQHVKMGEGLATSTRQQDAKISNLQDLISSLQQKTQKQVNALELKADSIDDRMALALAPISERMNLVEGMAQQLKIDKVNVKDALTTDDVTRAIQQANLNNNLQLNNAFNGLAGLQAQVDRMQLSKADKDTSIDHEKLAIALELLDVPGKLDQLQKRVDEVLKTKADLVKVDAEQKKLTVRSQCLETALLRGLRTISDKVSAALDTKADRSAFEEFRIHAKALISEMLVQIREWSPLARSTTHPVGCQDAVACLSCDSPVRTVKELKAAMYRDGHDILSPEKLPNMESWKASRPATTDPFRGGSHNGRLAAQRSMGKTPWSRPATTATDSHVQRMLWKSEPWFQTPQAMPACGTSPMAGPGIDFNSVHPVPPENAGMSCCFCGNETQGATTPALPAQPVLTVHTPAPPTPQQYPSTPASTVRLNKQTVSGQIAQGRLPTSNRRRRGDSSASRNKGSKAGLDSGLSSPAGKEDANRPQSPVIEGWTNQEPLFLDPEPTMAFSGMDSELQGSEASTGSTAANYIYTQTGHLADGQAHQTEGGITEIIGLADGAYAEPQTHTAEVLLPAEVQ